MITAGHVFKESTRVRVNATSGGEILEIPLLFQRVNHIPRYAAHITTDPFISDVGCLELPPHVGYRCVSHNDLPIDFTVAARFLKEDPDDNFDDERLARLSPHSTSMRQLKDIMLKEGGLEVFKEGSASGITSGRLYALLDPSGKDFTQSTSGTSTMGQIAWTDCEPFCIGGDSGSLVWAVLLGSKLPIGIHKGSHDGFSICWLIQGVFDVLEELYETDLFFCSSSYHGEEAA
jgi:hypothetical protein